MEVTYQMGKTKMKKDTKNLIISSVISLVISIVVTALFSQYSVLVFANLGIESSIMKLADESREYGSYDIAIKMYKKISDKDNEYSPYANAALGEIYSGNAMGNDYRKAFEYYKKAIKDSNDPIILKSCLRYVVNAVEYTKNETNAAKKVFDVYSDNYIDFVYELFNTCLESDYDCFEGLIFDLQFDKETIRALLEGKTIKYIKGRWNYVSTRYDKDSNLGFVAEEEKLLLVDSIVQQTNEQDFSTIVYKYYRYKMIRDTYYIELVDSLKWIIDNSTDIYLTKIDIENNEEAQK